MTTDLLDRKPADAPTDRTLRFQWRGSKDATTWSAWLDFTGEELATLRTRRGFGYRFSQARMLIDGREFDRTPIVTWPDECHP